MTMIIMNIMIVMIDGDDHHRHHHDNRDDHHAHPSPFTTPLQVTSCVYLNSAFATRSTFGTPCGFSS